MPARTKMRETWRFAEKDAFAAIENGVGALLEQGKRPVSLGGDHSITYPIVKAFARRYPELTIFHFDAHPDLYDEFEGNRLSHACPFARIMEAGLAKRLVQVGIRTINGHQREQAKRFGVEVVEMRGLAGLREAEGRGAGVHHVRYGRARSGVCAGSFASRAGRNVGAGGDCASACDRGRDCGGGSGRVQPGAGSCGDDGHGRGEDCERNFGEDDCRVGREQL